MGANDILQLNVLVISLLPLSERTLYQWQVLLVDILMFQSFICDCFYLQVYLNIFFRWGRWDWNYRINERPRYYKQICKRFFAYVFYVQVHILLPNEFNRKTRKYHVWIQFTDVTMHNASAKENKKPNSVKEESSDTHNISTYIIILLILLWQKNLARIYNLFFFFTTGVTYNIVNCWLYSQYLNGDGLKGFSFLI